MEGMKFTPQGKPEWPPRRGLARSGRCGEGLGGAYRAQGREIHFEIDDDGRLAIEMRDLDGDVMGPMSASEAVSIASGAPVR